MLVLLNSRYRPEVDAHSLNVSLSASDPVPTCSFVIEDKNSSINVTEMMEVIVLADDPSNAPTQNLVLDPLMSHSPLGSAGLSQPQAANPGSSGYYAFQKDTGDTITQGPPTVFTVVNSTTGCDLWQVTQPNTVSEGLTYTLSAFLNVTSPLTNGSAYLRMDCYDATHIGSSPLASVQVTTTAAGRTRYSCSVTAPAGTAYIGVFCGITVSSGTNSGTVQIDKLQLEPNWFTSAGVTYPTAVCNINAANCRILFTNQTTIRQNRLFKGYVTHIAFGPYVNSYRNITVGCSGLAFLFDTRLASKNWTNQFDDQIVFDLVDTYFPGLFSEKHIIRGVKFDALQANYDSARSVMDTLSSTSTFKWFVDMYNDTWYAPAGYYQVPYGLSDTPDEVTTYRYSNYSREIDFTQPVNGVYCLVSSGPNTVHVADGQSIAQYGFRFDRKIDDTTITSNAGAYQRSAGELLAYRTPREILHLEVDERNAQLKLQPGNAITFSNSVEGISNVSYLIQVVNISYIGTDNTNASRYLYQLQLGDYNPNLTSILTRNQRIAAQSSSTALSIVQENALALETISASEPTPTAM